jgi:heme exporter protein C
MLTTGHTIIFALIAFVLITLGLRLTGRLSPERFGSIWGWTALAVLALGLYVGLVWAPADRDMGDVQRIMYVHFPSWVGTGGSFLTAFVASFLYLARRKPRFDNWACAGVETGLVFNAVGLITGSIWGRPTWGIWWTWDPRLTTTAIMFITFAGYLALRAYIEDPDARARVSAVVAIVAFINVPVVYMSVKWWRTLHQVQSSPMTVDPRMVVALRLMMLAFLFLAGWMMSRRMEIARLQGEAERRGWELEEAR